MSCRAARVRWIRTNDVTFLDRYDPATQKIKRRPIEGGVSRSHKQACRRSLARDCSPRHCNHAVYMALPAAEAPGTSSNLPVLTS